MLELGSLRHVSCPVPCCSNQTVGIPGPRDRLGPCVVLESGRVDDQGGWLFQISQVDGIDEAVLKC